MDERFNKAEAGFVSEEHGYRASRIANMLEEAGLPVYGSDGRSLQALLWSTATPESSRAHLFLALDSATSEQVAESGLDRFLSLRDALIQQSAGQPQLVDYVVRLTEGLPFDAFRIVQDRKQDLLAFLGSQEIKGNLFGIEYRGTEVMLHKEAVSLVAASPQGVWKLRQRISAGRENFDKAVAENWDRLSPLLKRDFIAMLDARSVSAAELLEMEVYLAAFPLALKSEDWRAEVVAALSRRRSGSCSDPGVIVWEEILKRFECVAPR